MTDFQSSTANAEELYALRDLIASHIECEKDCKAMPTGCGCALTAARAVLNRHAQGSMESRQHIGWLKQYIEGMTADNWQDMRLRARRQLEELSKALTFPSTERSPAASEDRSNGA